MILPGKYIKLLLLIPALAIGRPSADSSLTPKGKIVLQSSNGNYLIPSYEFIRLYATDGALLAEGYPTQSGENILLTLKMSHTTVAIETIGKIVIPRKMMIETRARRMGTIGSYAVLGYFAIAYAIPDNPNSYNLLGYIDLTGIFMIAGIGYVIGGIIGASTAFQSTTSDIELLMGDDNWVIIGNDK